MKNGRFKKGHKTWNKGTNGICKSNSGSFRKGQSPWNKGTVGLMNPWNKGKKMPLAYRKKLSKAHIGKMTGPDNPKWKGGKSISTNGYIISGSGRRRIYEHRLVMQQFLGRHLKRSEVIHHKNHNKLDNRIENLELLSSDSHRRLHAPKGARFGANAIKKKKFFHE